MKRGYEQPLMVAEVYDTNAYCGACTDNPQFNTKELVVNEGSTWTTPGGSGNMLPTLQADGYDVSHTFNAADRKNQTSYSIASWGQQQYYWPCSCSSHEDGASRYYLEYSAYWSQRKETFVLFKELPNSNNPNSLDVHWSNTTFPQTDFTDGRRRTDQALAAVTFSNPMIADS